MLGARIAALRREAGWSQGELAQLLQVSPSAVGMYEQGRREPSAEMLVVMARAFNVTVDYLLTGRPIPGEQPIVASAINTLLTDADRRLDGRTKRPLSREELAVIFAALLLEG